MVIGKRRLIGVCAVGVAAFAALAVRNIQLMYRADKAQQTLSYSYSRAIGDLADACENLSASLEKQLYADSGRLQQSLAVNLYREASDAKAALSQLPVAELNLENTYKFLSQVGNYSLAVSKELAAQEDSQGLTDEEYDNISVLYDFSVKLSEDMRSLENSVVCGELDPANGDSQTVTAVSEENPPTVIDGFSDFEDSFEDYPTLIYDGPFSDNILERQPEMTTNAQEVDVETALYRASAAVNVATTDLSVCDEVSGKMSGWRFSDEGMSVSCEVTKGGGYVSYFLKSRLVSETGISKAQALNAAEEFLDELGLPSMKRTYYEIEGNVMTVNFAYYDLNKIVYADLVKVSVAMDDGEILGYDGRGYLVNHHKRDYPDSLISLTRAESEVSPRLEILSSQLALIPTDGLEEKLCYEFRCQSEKGRNVLVYINAQTAEEEKILILIESDSGTLTQ